MPQPAPAPAEVPQITINYSNGQFSVNRPTVQIPNGGSADFFGGFAAGTTCTVCFNPTTVFGASLQVDANQTKSTGAAGKSNVLVSYTLTAGTCAQPGNVGNGNTIQVGS